MNPIFPIIFVSVIVRKEGPAPSCSRIVALSFSSCARINKADVRTPALFHLMQKVGGISEHDMFNTFNMGVGMVLTVPAEQADKALEILHANGEPEAYRLGVIAEGEGVELC